MKKFSEYGRASGSRVRLTCLGLVLFLGISHSWAGGETVRPEVGTALRDAQAALAARQLGKAKDKIQLAQNVKGKTPFEASLVDQMAGAVAAASGDTPGAIKAFEASISDGGLSGAQRLQVNESLIGLHFSAREYPSVVRLGRKYMADGGKNPLVTTALAQSYFHEGNCADLATLVNDTMKISPSEDLYVTLYSCYKRKGDAAREYASLMALVQRFPKPQYWQQAIDAVRRQPGYSRKLDIHLYRLRRATDTLATTVDFTEMAQLALLSGSPFEATSVLDDGFKRGVLGQGATAKSEQRLRAVASQDAAAAKQALSKSQAAEGGESALAVAKSGYRTMTAGDSASGLAALKRAVQMPDASATPEASLTLVEGYILAGSPKEALGVLKALGKGDDSVSQIARLWSSHLSQQGAGARN